jgi:hypothetical protein
MLTNYYRSIVLLCAAISIIIRYPYLFFGIVDKLGDKRRDIFDFRGMPVTGYQFAVTGENGNCVDEL